MDEQELEAALKRLEERTLDLTAVRQEYVPDLGELDNLIARLAPGSEQRRRLELTSSMFKTSRMHAELLLEQKTVTSEVLHSILGLHRRVVALEEIVTALAGRVSELERS